ncbi:MAG TPA: hypothetical protein VG276_07870 [Actinomycetes bacterium]|nr:hypothetical protein [Actinomycetes bacterium]
MRTPPVGRSRPPDEEQGGASDQRTGDRPQGVEHALQPERPARPARGGVGGDEHVAGGVLAALPEPVDDPERADDPDRRGQRQQGPGQQRQGVGGAGVSRSGEPPRSTTRPVASRATVTPTASAPSTAPSLVVDAPRATTTKTGGSG